MMDKKKEAEKAKADCVTPMQAVSDITLLSIPNVIIFVLTNINEMVSLVFIGQTGKEDYISAVGLSTSVLGMIILQPLFAIGSSLDTLIARAFGNGNYRLCGDYLNKAAVLVIAFYIPLGCVLLYVKNILLAIGFEKSIAELLGLYTPRMLLHVLAFVFFYVINRFLNAQQIVYPQMIITALTSLLHPVLCYAFIFKYDFGCFGLNFAYTITSTVSLVSIVVYMLLSSKARKALTMPSLKLFENYLEFLKLSLAGMINDTLEWWGYYILMLWGGYMSSISAATNQIISNIDVIFSMIPTGVGSALTTLVGNSFGKNNPKEAKLYASVSVAINMVIFLVSALALYTYRASIAAFYTPNTEIQALYEKILPLALFSFLMETINILLGRIFVSEGKQDWLGKVNFILYYVIMIPVSYLFMSVLKLEIYGLWIIMSLSSVISVSILLTKLYFQDWGVISNEIANASKEEATKPKQD
eukprot:TRINITY_DN12776_c0_g1_i2.p1 TRINITY_DN12776_c0_g1~~TRINITY_DN12776_c0_g1_i2.p1  ORF type:complete len:529 (+),score=103.38 TRINITY_DN12776_c0_g1_i2:174-1589(+)